MAITRVSVGAHSFLGAPGAPAGSASGDLWLCLAGVSGGGAASMDAAWTLQATFFSISNERITIWSFPYTGSAPALTVTGGDRSVIIAYRPSSGLALSLDGTPVGQAVASTSVINLPTMTPTQTGDMCVFGAVWQPLATTYGTGNVTGTDPVCGAPFFDQNDGGILEFSVSDGIRSVATATGARTQTINDLGPAGGIVVLLKEVSSSGTAVLSGTVLT